MDEQAKFGENDASKVKVWLVDSVLKGRYNGISVAEVSKQCIAMVGIFLPSGYH